jgi:transcriptional regulator with GAF, ATPase, and Fis domain
VGELRIRHSHRLTRQLAKAQGLSKLIGEAPTFRAAIEIIETAAESDAPVLIAGETGTGKELVARALHYLSDRATFPFVAINCDELFGHERGAFTDAHQPRVSRHSCLLRRLPSRLTIDL